VTERWALHVRDARRKRANLRPRTAIVAMTGLLIFASLQLPAQAAAETPYDFVWFERFAGANRYATAAEISLATYPDKVPYAFVATGENFPDALAAGAAASFRHGPVLLVRRTSIPTPTAAELASLQPQRIVVVGGEGSVSKEVAAALAKYATTGQVLRYAGPDRYATAAAVSRLTFGAGVSTAYIATGANFPDALSGVPATAGGAGPVLLVRTTSIPSVVETELLRLKPKRIVVLGGTGVVSAGVATQLGAYTQGAVHRWAGANRYATSVAVSQATYHSTDVVFLATGLNYPDALAGGPAAAEWGGPLLLVGTTSVPSVVMNELRRLNPYYVVILGGTGVVSDSVSAAIESGLGFRSYDPGLLVVGTQIPPGTYRALPGENCGWARLGIEWWDIIASGGWKPHSVVTIKPTDAVFETSCSWTTNFVPIGDRFESHTSAGTYLVNWDIEPGTYTAPGGDSCLWIRLSGFSGESHERLEAHIGQFNPVVTIEVTDAGFLTEYCGNWTAVP
jgi:putative cell wall-binding protein